MLARSRVRSRSRLRARAGPSQRSARKTFCIRKGSLIVIWFAVQSPSRHGRAAHPRWLATLLLVLYVAAVHGLPALHLGWHDSHHVHERGRLRWLKARPLVHSHVHKAGDATESDHFEVPKWTAQRPHPRLCANLEPPTDGAAPHLAAGPAHGQASLLAPGALLALGPVQSSIVQPSGQIDICRRVLFSDRRARAPPASS